MRKKLTAEFVVLFLATVGVGGAQTSGQGRRIFTAAASGE